MQVHSVFERYARGTGLRVGLAIGQTNFLEEQLALVGEMALAGETLAISSVVIGLTFVKSRHLKKRRDAWLSTLEADLDLCLICSEAFPVHALQYICTVCCSSKHDTRVAVEHVRPAVASHYVRVRAD